VTMWTAAEYVMRNAARMRLEVVFGYPGREICSCFTQR